MPDTIPLHLVFEDTLSEIAMHKIVAGTNRFTVGYSYSEGGFGYIKRNIRGFNEAARGCPFFVLTDLDSTHCAPTLIRDWLTVPKHENLIFRVAVREVEAWVLADIEGFSDFTGISRTNFHDNPEDIDNPKEELMRLIMKCRKRSLREDILPKDQFAKIGPNYNGRLGEFVSTHWNIARAADRSDSLNRALQLLNEFEPVYN